MSWPVSGGARGSRLPGLSLRVGQARMGGNSGNPIAGDPIQHRELFRMEVFGPRAVPALDMRLELGGRMTYDLKRGVFGLRADGWKRPSVVPADSPTSNSVGFQPNRFASPLWEVGSLKHIPVSAASKSSVVVLGVVTPAAAASGPRG